tara:strand:- start:1675 stop:2055 length:381 start_codon:yes stop_codon:yes gene_type:complete
MKQTYLTFPNTVEVHTKTITTSAAGQRKASFTLNSTVNVRVQSGSGSRTTSGYISEVDSYTMTFSHEDKALIIYDNRLKNLKDRDGTVIEVGPLEILNVEKKLGISGKINHLVAQITKVKEGSEND